MESYYQCCLCCFRISFCFINSVCATYLWKIVSFLLILQYHNTLLLFANQQVYSLHITCTLLSVQKISTVWVSMVIKALGSTDFLQTAPWYTTASIKDHSIHRPCTKLLYSWYCCIRVILRIRVIATIIKFYDYMLLTGHC